MKIFYHGDKDGQASGAIVYKYYIKENRTTEDYEFIKINYDIPFPFETIEPNELVIIVDFSLQHKGDFQKLKNITNNIIWIDHHITAIRKHDGIELEGLRRDGTAGCALTWEYFYPNTKMPIVVALLADYDVWTFKYGDTTNHLQVSLSMYNASPESTHWDKWLNPEYVAIEEIEKGKNLIAYRNKLYKGFVRNHYFAKIKGYKAICCNSNVASSQLFDSVNAQYDLMILYCFNGDLYRVSLYSVEDGIDVSKIAEKYGGGGHVHASGFSCKKLPFKKIRPNIFVRFSSYLKKLF